MDAFAAFFGTDAMTFFATSSRFPSRALTSRLWGAALSRSPQRAASGPHKPRSGMTSDSQSHGIRKGPALLAAGPDPSKDETPLAYYFND
jgi:hypothetical protein